MNNRNFTPHKDINFEHLDRFFLLVKYLEKKKNYLFISAVVNGLDSSDFKKYVMVKTLLKNINKATKLFKKRFLYEKDDEKIREVLCLIDTIFPYIQYTLENQKIIHSVPHYNKIDILNVGVCSTLATVTSLSTILTFTVLSGGYISSNAETTLAFESFKLISNMEVMLKQVITNLTDYLSNTQLHWARYNTLSERTRGALALNNPSCVFNNLPLEIKNKILSHIHTGREGKTFLNKLDQYGLKLLYTTHSFWQNNKKGKSKMILNKASPALAKKI